MFCIGVPLDVSIIVHLVFRESLDPFSSIWTSLPRHLIFFLSDLKSFDMFAICRLEFQLLMAFTVFVDNTLRKCFLLHEKKIHRRFRMAVFDYCSPLLNVINVSVSIDLNCPWFPDEVGFRFGFSYDHLPFPMVRFDLYTMCGRSLSCYPDTRSVHLISSFSSFYNFFWQRETCDSFFSDSWL